MANLILPSNGQFGFTTPLVTGGDWWVTNHVTPCPISPESSWPKIAANWSLGTPRSKWLSATCENHRHNWGFSLKPYLIDEKPIVIPFSQEKILWSHHHPIIIPSSSHHHPIIIPSSSHHHPIIIPFTHWNPIPSCYDKQSAMENPQNKWRFIYIYSWEDHRHFYGPSIPWRTGKLPGWVIPIWGILIVNVTI